MMPYNSRIFFAVVLLYLQILVMRIHASTPSLQLPNKDISRVIWETPRHSLPQQFHPSLLLTSKPSSYHSSPTSPDPYLLGILLSRRSRPLPIQALSSILIHAMFLTYNSPPNQTIPGFQTTLSYPHSPAASNVTFELTSAGRFAPLQMTNYRLVVALEMMGLFLRGVDVRNLHEWDIDVVLANRTEYPVIKRLERIASGSVVQPPVPGGEVE